MDHYAGKLNCQRSLHEVCGSPCVHPPTLYSSNISEVAAQTDSIISAKGELLSFADRGLSLFRARTMKDFENQIADLKKENFNLKLRIYFLEEQVKEKFDGANENIYKTNIELKVEVESLKHHLQEKHNLLIKASNAVESLTGDSGSAVLRVRADAEKQFKKVEEFLNSKIIQLEEDLKIAQKSVETVSLLLEEEKNLRMRLEQKPDATSQIEKDKNKEQLNLVLNSKDQAILSDQTYVDDKIKELTDYLCRKDHEIESLQLQLKIKAEEFDEEKKNSFKRDKTIQGLTLALKTKEKEHNANNDYEEHLANSELMNFVKKTDRNLEIELDEICLLRKQLEENIQAYQELCKSLEERNKMGKSRDDDTFSLVWDQTAYLSICLGEKDPLNLEMENLSLVELRKKVRQLLLLVQELQSQILAQNSKWCKHCAAAFEAEGSDHVTQNMGVPSTYMREVTQQLLMSEQTDPQSVEFAEKLLETEEMTKPEVKLTSSVFLSDLSGNIVLKCRVEQSNMGDDSEAKNCSDLSKTKFYEDLKNIIVKLRNEHDHFSIGNKILKQDVGVQISFPSRSISPSFIPAPIPVAVSPISVEDNCSVPAGEEDQPDKGEWTSKKKQQLIDDKVLIAAKELNPTNVTQKNFKKSHLPIPLKSMNSGSRKMTTVSKKILMDQPDTVDEMQKMQLEEKTKVHDLTDIVNEGLAKEKVHLQGCEVQNPVDETSLFLETEGSKLCFQKHVDTSSNKHNHMVGHNIQTSPSTLQDRSDLQLQLKRYQNSYTQTLTSPEQQGFNEQDFKYDPANIIECEPALQNEKAESMTRQNQVTDLQRQVGALAPSGFASLVQSQACQLSFQRQQILDGRNMCIVYHNHLINLIKAFEELLQASDVDYYVAEGFREQLNQSMHLLQKLEGKLCYETQNENDNLKESLSKKSYVCDHLHNEYERVQKENETFCKKLDERDEEIKRLTQELSNALNAFNRLHRELKVQQYLLSDDSQVLKSLKAELEVYQKMSEAIKTETDLMNNEHRYSQQSNHSMVNLSTTVPKVFSGSQMWADKNGCHVLGLNEDYCMLHKHISEVWKLLSKTKTLLEDIGSKQHRLSGSEVPDQGFFERVGKNVRRAQKTLEDATCLSKLFWRVTLPRTVNDDSTDMEEMKMEIIQLRNTLSHHKKKLHSTMKQLHSANLIKENMEKIITDQLALTHEVLKKARGNLENQPSEI